MQRRCYMLVFFFFFLNDPPPPEISPLPLHAALPIYLARSADERRRAPSREPHHDGPEHGGAQAADGESGHEPVDEIERDRKSTRLNSSHGYISYAVFCLKKKKTPPYIQYTLHTASAS